MAAQQTENLIGKKELAKFLGVSEGTVTRMVITGTGPRYHRVGLFVKFKMSDVHDWLERRAVDPREKVMA
jgi:excisionase family DNA binding protein